MARIVVHVAHVVGTGDAHTFFQQVFVNIHQAAAWENFFEMVVLELLEAGAAGNEDGFDVQIVERIGQTVKEHAVAVTMASALASSPAPRCG